MMVAGAYFGAPFIWCMLNDFGGNNGTKPGTPHTHPGHSPHHTLAGTPPYSRNQHAAVTVRPQPSHRATATAAAAAAPYRQGCGGTGRR